MTVSVLSPYQLEHPGDTQACSKAVTEYEFGVTGQQMAQCETELGEACELVT